MLQGEMDERVVGRYARRISAGLRNGRVRVRSRRVYMKIISRHSLNMDKWMVTVVSDRLITAMGG